jgi:hypothetical protein
MKIFIAKQIPARNASGSDPVRLNASAASSEAINCLVDAISVFDSVSFLMCDSVKSAILSELSRIRYTASLAGGVNMVSSIPVFSIAVRTVGSRREKRISPCRTVLYMISIRYPCRYSSNEPWDSKCNPVCRRISLVPRSNFDDFDKPGNMHLPSFNIHCYLLLSQE